MSIKEIMPKLLDEAKVTFSERAASYGENYIQAEAVMMALYPNGILVENYNFLAHDFLHHIISKLTRLVNADLNHFDSAYDLGIYALMLAAHIKDMEK